MSRKIPENLRSKHCGGELIDQLDFALDLLRTAMFALQNPEPGALDQGDTVTISYVVSYACDAINQVRDAIDASRRAAE